jgi:hypothetical protein
MRLVENENVEAVRFGGREIAVVAEDCGRPPADDAAERLGKGLRPGGVVDGVALSRELTHEVDGDDGFSGSGPAAD